MSGGRPEVILPQDPTPVLGLCVLGFPLWAPPRFSDIQLGLGNAPHCTPDWTTYEGDLKGHSTLSQECCPSFASCCLVKKRRTLAVRGYLVKIKLTFNILLLNTLWPILFCSLHEEHKNTLGRGCLNFPPFLLSSYMKYVSISQCTVFILTAFKSLKPLFSDAGPVTLLF